MNKCSFKFLILSLISIFNLSVFGAKEQKIVFSNKLENLEESEDALQRRFLAAFAKDNLSNDFINVSCAIYKYNFLNPYKINSDLLNAAIVENLFNLSFKDFSQYTKTIVGKFFLGLTFVKEKGDFGCLAKMPSFNCMPAIKYNKENFEKINAAIDKSKAGEIAFFNLFNKTIDDFNVVFIEDKKDKKQEVFNFKDKSKLMKFYNYFDKNRIFFYLSKYGLVLISFIYLIRNFIFYNLFICLRISGFYLRFFKHIAIACTFKIVFIRICIFLYTVILYKKKMNSVFRMKKECIEIAKALYSLKNACELIENDEELLNYIPEVKNFESLFNSEDKELNSLLKVLLSESFLVADDKLFFDSKVYVTYKTLLDCKEKLMPFFALLGVIDSRLVVFNFDEQLKDNEFFCKVKEFRRGKKISWCGNF